MVRRKVVSFAGVILSGILSYAIPKCLEVFGVITSQSFWLPYSILIGIIVFLLIAVWGYWPDIKRIEKKKEAKKMVLNIGLAFVALGVVSLIVGSVLTIPRLKFQVDTRAPIQVQLDTLISDITNFEKTIPPMPTQNPGESWNDYTQRLLAYNQITNSEWVAEFNSRIIDTINKLHDIRIISDSEYQNDQQYITSVAAQPSIWMVLLPRLQAYKVSLDTLEQTMNAK
jgi:hypothetical protein